MAKTKTTKVACPNCGDASRRNQRPLNDEDHQVQCHKCGMVYRVDGEPVVDDHDGSGTGEGRRAKAEMERQTPKIKTYEATINGRKVRCTVPEDDKPEDIMFDLIRDCLSPQAVAAIAAYLLPVKTNNAQVNKQVEWFTDSLIKMLGTGEYTNLCEGLGL